MKVLFTGKDFIKLLNEKNIKHIVTPFAQGVERFNRTLKNMPILKLKAKGKEEQFRWVDALQDTLNKYNNQEHSTIKMTPNEAKKEVIVMLFISICGNEQKEIEPIRN